MAAKIGKNEQKEHTYKKFGSDLKNGNLPQVLFMYGSEQYLVEWAAESLIKKYVNPAASTFDYVKLDDDDVEVSEIIGAADIFPMFSEKRIVWIKSHSLLTAANPKGFSSVDKENLNSYIENPNEGSLLIFSCEEPDEKSEVVKCLKKCAGIYNFDKLDRAQLTAFAEKRFHSAGVSIRRDLLRYLIDETGYFNRETDYRIFNLENDIKKIIAHSDGNAVSREDIAETLNGDMDTYIFNFLDAAANRKKETAFSMLHSMLSAGSNVTLVTAMLINQFELLLDVSEFREDSMPAAEIARTINANEFRVKKTMALTDKFTKPKIKEILCQLYETDRNIKSGLLEPTLALELLVGRI